MLLVFISPERAHLFTHEKMTVLVSLKLTTNENSVTRRSNGNDLRQETVESSSHFDAI